jgi:hypothetical protein
MGKFCDKPETQSKQAIGCCENLMQIESQTWIPDHRGTSSVPFVSGLPKMVPSVEMSVAK